MIVGAPRIAYHIGSPMESNRGNNDVLSKYLVDHSSRDRVQAIGASRVVGKVAIDVHRSVHNRSISLIGSESSARTVYPLFPLTMIETHCVCHRCHDYLPRL